MNWFKRQMLALSVALSNVEKNALGQGGEMLSDDINTVQRHKQGMLSDDLMQGRITQEVITLRARMYKVLEESENYGYSSGDRGNKRENKISDKIKGEPSDDYKVEMVVSNEKITSDFLSSIEDIDSKPISPIVIGRKILPKFKIEDYAKKLYIKDIGDGTKLFEFFITKYTDTYDKKTKFLIKEIEKSKHKPWSSDFLDIKEIGFITHNTLGVKNNLEFQYDVIEYNKIVDFDGNYVIKFKGVPIVDGVNILEKYSDEELDKKYANKEKRK